MIKPRQAPVRPRIFVRDAAGLLPLEDEVQARLDARAFGVLELVGESGSGKSTAPAHLAEIFVRHPDLELADHPNQIDCEQLAIAAYDHLVVYAAGTNRIPYVVPDQVEIAPWGDDDCIEYLPAGHRERCASVA